jgi:hypothetical protein
MSDDWKFRGNVYSALQAKADALAEVIRMLREDHPLTADDKRALAEFIEWLTLPPKRGRPQAEVFSVTWHIQRIAQEVRQRAERDDSLTLEDAALRALAAQEIRPEITLEQVLQELRRAAKKKPI